MFEKDWFLQSIIYKVVSKINENIEFSLLKKIHFIGAEYISKHNNRAKISVITRLSFTHRVLGGPELIITDVDIFSQLSSKIWKDLGIFIVCA